MPSEFKQSSLRRQVLGLVVVLIVGSLVTARQQASSESVVDAAHAAEAASAGGTKGPHGGWQFEQGEFALELSIYERGVEPQFRIYGYLAGRPIAPAELQAEVSLERLGRAPQVFRFSPESDYLRGDAVVFEPHSFVARIAVTHADQDYRFEVEQVEARITMSEAQLAASGVTVAAAGPALIRDTVELTGEIALDQDRTMHIVPRVAGVVSAVHAKAGERVAAGQLLAEISSQTLAEMRANLRATRHDAEFAEQRHARELRLWKAQISAEQDYQAAEFALHERRIAAETARQALVTVGAAAEDASGNLARYVVVAPMAGVITAKYVVTGDAVGADRQLFVISDLGSVWVETQVHARNLADIRPGQEVKVTAPGLDAESTGTIDFIGPLVGEHTRTALARVVLPNPDGIWRPGLPVKASVVTAEAQVPVAVAAGAVQNLRDWTVVFGRYGTAFEARVITVGRSDGVMTEVVEGLAVGEQYAAENSFLIKADIGKSGASHDH
jgi:cobalt-zinc-cadmium efflux system membrane fusion protein